MLVKMLVRLVMYSCVACVVYWAKINVVPHILTEARPISNHIDFVTLKTSCRPNTRNHQHLRRAKASRGNEMHLPVRMDRVSYAPTAKSCILHHDAGSFPVDVEQYLLCQSISVDCNQIIIDLEGLTKKN